MAWSLITNQVRAYDLLRARAFPAAGLTGTTSVRSIFQSSMGTWLGVSGLSV